MRRISPKLQTIYTGKYARKHATLVYCYTNTNDLSFIAHLTKFVWAILILGKTAIHMRNPLIKYVTSYTMNLMDLRTISLDTYWVHQNSKRTLLRRCWKFYELPDLRIQNSIYNASNLIPFELTFVDTKYKTKRNIFHKKSQCK